MKKRPTTGLTNRVSAGGSYRTDRQMKALGIGRLQVSLGTSNAIEAARRNGIITRLKDEEEVDILTALRDHRLSVQSLTSWWDEGPTVAKLKTRFAKEEGALGAASQESASDATGEQVEVHPEKRTATWAYARALWPALRDTRDDLEKSPAGYNTRTRYLVALRSLHTVLKLGSLPPQIVFEIAALPESVKHALWQVRQRGITMADAYRAARTSKRHRDSLPGFKEARIGDTALKALRKLPQHLAHEIADRLTYVPRMQSVLNLAMLLRGQLPKVGLVAPGRRAKEVLERITTCSQTLGENATVDSLEALERQDWEGLLYIWGAGPTDWNQMRRMLSARLTCITGDEHDRVRHRAITRIPLRAEQKRGKRLSPEQYALMLSVMPEYDLAVMVTITLGGMRWSEFLHVTEEDLIHNTCTVRLGGEKSEASADNLPISPSLWRHVQTAVPMVYGKAKLRNVLRAACEAVGLEPIRIHDLRHCTAHFAILGGATPAELMAFLRHSSPKMLATYLNAADKTRVAAALHRVIGASLDGDASGNGYASTPAGTSEFNGLSREDLYELVWTTPASRLQERLGISDKGLVMRCRKHRIPTPPRGYWLKSDKGKAAARLPLPQL